MVEDPYFGYNRPDIVNHTFGVKFIDESNETLVSNVELICTGDWKTNLYLSTHPRWNSDCSLFVLAIIQQYLWDVKLITVTDDKPFELLGKVYDARCGSIDITLRAKIIDNHYLQNWPLPIVNFANTHIAKLISDICNSKPSLVANGDDYSDLKKAFIKDRENRHKEYQKLQKIHLDQFNGNDKKFGIYIDESGDIGFQQDIYSLYINVAVVIEAQYVTEIVEKLRALIPQIWGTSAPREIHFNKIPDSKVETVRAEYIKILCAKDIKFFCFIADKANYLKYLCRCHAESRRMEAFPVDFTMKEYIENSELYLKYNFLSISLSETISHITMNYLEQGSSVVSIVHDKKHRDWMNKALDAGFILSQKLVTESSKSYYGKDLSSSACFALEHSPDCPLLWLSDWIAYEMNQYLSGKELSKEIESIRDKNISTIIAFDENGQKLKSDWIGSVAQKQYKDIPINIYEYAKLAAQQNEKHD